MDHKRCPSPHLTADANFTTMSLDNLLYNGQPQASAMPFAPGTRWIDLIETIKKTRQRILRNTRI